MIRCMGESRGSNALPFWVVLSCCQGSILPPEEHPPLQANLGVQAVSPFPAGQIWGGSGWTILPCRPTWAGHGGTDKWSSE